MASYPRHAEVTATDHGPLVNIASWILMCTSVLFTIFRLISNVILRNRLSGDDWIILAATALAVGQSVSVSFLVDHGLGQHQDTLSESTLELYEQALVASSVLYVCTLAFSKFSLLFFLSRLIPVAKKTFRHIMKTTWAVMGLYLVSEVFTLSFQCSLPKVYNFMGGHCINLRAFWDFDAAFDIVSSLVILALPMIVVRPLQMKRTLKFKAVSAFLFQIPACAFAVVRLIYLHQAIIATDHTWVSIHWQIWTSINMHYSVVAANIPCLKVFLEGFQSTLFRAETNSRYPSVVALRSEVSKRKGSHPNHLNSSQQQSAGRSFSNVIPEPTVEAEQGDPSDVTTSSVNTTVERQRSEERNIIEKKLNADTDSN